MVELDKVRYNHYIKDFSGTLKNKVETEDYEPYLKLNEVNNLDDERRIRVELRKRGYKLKAKMLFLKRTTQKETIRNLIKGLLNQSKCRDLE